jgi:Protein of unknown function (DUF4031)
MAVYVDNAKVKWRGRQWCHLVADTIEELHEFAYQLGLQKNWFQHAASYPHYDVTVEVREIALSLGAIEGDRIRIITCARKMKTQLHREIVPRQEEQLILFQSC